MNTFFLQTSSRSARTGLRMPHPAAWGGILVALFMASSACAADSSASEPSVFQRVSSAVERGVKAAASGIERGAAAAASGVERGASAVGGGVETGAKATQRTATTVARKLGLPQSASAPGSASSPLNAER